MDTSHPHRLERFVEGQKGTFENALLELRAGKKQSHWMWFIFPQLAGLGRSPTALFYGISSLAEAQAYLDHPLLGPRLRSCADALLQWKGERSALEIFGPVDTMKLRSSLSLFDQLEPHGIFDQLLLNFFAGERDELTLALLDRQQ